MARLTPALRKPAGRRRLWPLSLRAQLLVLVALIFLPILGIIAYTGVEQRRQAAAVAHAEAMRVVQLAGRHSPGAVRRNPAAGAVAGAVAAGARG